MDKRMILAIETSCDETSIAILKDGKELLANIVSSQIDFHKKYGGVMPEMASRLHVEKITICIEEALNKANIGYKDITLIAVTKGPGLIGALHIGLQAAKALSIAYNIPIVALNHIAGHIYANRYVKDFSFPLLALVVSGGHTELIYMKDEYKFEIIGETKDDAIGEAYDKVARILGLSYPGGPIIDKLAKLGSPIYTLPYPKVEGKYNFSYSGIKTAVLNLVQKLKKSNKEYKKEDISSSFQTLAIKILVDKTIEALKDYKVKQVLVAGGVSANSHLREEIVKRVKRYDKSVDVVIPPLWCCTDNAAMIAMAAYYSDNKAESLDFGVDPSLVL